MKYCKICKTTAKETDTVCAKGHPLAVFGASPQAPPAERPPTGTSPKPAEVKPGPKISSAERPTVGTSPRPGEAKPGPKTSSTMFTLLGEVQKLEETQKKNVKRGRAFALLSLAAALAILL